MSGVLEWGIRIVYLSVIGKHGGINDKPAHSYPPTYPE